ncbi:amidohydrolase family protein [Aurantibacter crassamenti]|uniref:amidohydrolase family protein n=1 Tax=Aurantibacter crassamenti TaxID=1837375 RepID=UPI00193AB96D|nr:amidohydrolase family protein [Aurantibacter crassamenti]MBM1108191.1 amidohydrolase family protein [Aurantibacter crassamenti]
MKNLTYLVLAFLTIMGCKPKSDKETTNKETVISLDKKAIKKVDVHAHYEFDRDYFSDFFEEWNMQAVLVDVAYHDSIGVGRSWDEYVALEKLRPNLFWLCSSLIGAGIDEPNYAEKEIARLTKEIEQGAKMVKVWKNFGMITKDKSGKFIQIDDERLQPIWNFLQERDIAVMAHIGEPIQAWRPLDDKKNPHYGYYTEHPEYHAFKHSEIPTYETIIAARDNWISQNPELKILCAHMGSMSHDVDMIAKHLDKYDNIYVEPAARFGDLVGQDEEKIRAFFTKYEDRIMFGTDFGNHIQQDSLSTTELEKELAELEREYALRWQYLSSTDTVEIRSQKSVGLGLSEEILQKVYYQNFADFLNVE